MVVAGLYAEVKERGNDRDLQPAWTQEPRNFVRDKWAMY